MCDEQWVCLARNGDHLTQPLRKVTRLKHEIHSSGTYKLADPVTLIKQPTTLRTYIILFFQLLHG
jgi:hypothetical protein